MVLKTCLKIQTEERKMDSHAVKIVLASCHPSSKGGISTWVKQMQKRLNYDSRIEVEYVYPAYNPENNQQAAERSFFERVFGSLRIMKRRLHEFNQVIACFEPDVLHLTTSGSLALFRDIRFLKTAKRKSISTVYHLRFGRIPEVVKRRGWEYKMLKKAISLSDCTIAIDHRTEKVLKGIVPQKRVLYIPNFIDTSSLENITESKQKKVVFVGWCVKTKGIEELLMAWERIAKEFPAYQLQLIGPISEDYKRKLMDHYALFNVDFAGEQTHEETMNNIGQASVFILPSYTEGFPNVILEAMALGKPIIATDVGAIPDMLEGCGLVIPSHDQHAIYNSLKKLLSDNNLQNQLGELAKKRLNETYTVETVYEQYVKVWKEIRDRNA